MTLTTGDVWSSAVAQFRNTSDDASELTLRMSVASSDPSSFYQIGGVLMPRPGRWQEDWFQLDTGAQRSMICGGLAMDLGLNLDGETVAIETVRGFVRVKESFFRVNIGSQWVRLPCWVPWPVERTRNIEENLLGLTGLLEKYDILLTKDTVSFYKQAQ